MKIMEESTGSQYALHIALQTLKERCQNLQHRLAVLEEENTSLRVKCNKIESRNESFSEADALKARITQLTEQKAKLKNNLAMVANENRNLWTQLSNLSQVNKSIGSHLTKINESLKQHTRVNQAARTPLIRSNTFTHSDQPVKHKAIVESDRISLELEDISLKFISTIAREKSELEAQCSEMAEIQNAVVTNSFGFSYPSDDVSDSLAEEFTQHVTNLREIRDSLLQQKEKLQEGVLNLHSMIMTRNVNCDKCCERKAKEVRNIVENVLHTSVDENAEEELQLESLARWGTPENSNTFLQENLLKTRTNICPMCSLIFHCNNVDSDIMFQQHVENHFIDCDHL